MGSYTKHRANDRLTIPGASAYPCMRISRWKSFLRSTRSYSLYNINKSGICFESSRLYKMGEVVCIMVKIPGEKSFYVEASIKWIEDKPRSAGYSIGAQLQPFGKGKNLNSFKTLQRLRDLHKKHSEVLQTSLAHS
jgi:Tfp pilus assembly protein PilZ